MTVQLTASGRWDLTLSYTLTLADGCQPAGQLDPVPQPLSPAGRSNG